MKSPSPCEFRRSVELVAPTEQVWAFHGDPRNAAKISPAWQTVRVIDGAPVPEPGAEFEIEVRLFGLLPMRWRGVWREVDKPTRLVDAALSSPFAFWIHRHLFEQLADGRTRMTDHVSYQFPGGWLGKVFGETAGRLQFHLMFADRHRRTVRWMREHSAASRSMASS